MTDTPARSFQHYEVLRRLDGTAWELGRGAMGVTYKAFDVNLCCEVALKVVSAALVEHPEARERFVREARAAAALRHRNVASVYHLGNDGEHFFYAMEFINGETLDALVRRGGVLSVENTLRVVLQVARALGAAERQHLVHRDIKPSNLMVTHEDADDETVVKVIDFGLARAAATAENAAPLTITGFVGTPQYASPEQLEERPLDARSDFYSLGVTAWFLLTGRAPFAGSLAAVCQQQLTLPPPWEQLPPEVPTCLRGLLGHLLAKDAARRPQNAADLRAEIETCLEKVRGTERKRPLQLPVLPPTAEVVPVRDGSKKTAAREWGTGTVLNRRYRLLGEVGGNHGVRVYRARDTEGDRLVAIKILPGTPDSDASGLSRLAEEVRLVQAASHPRLVKICGLERSPAPAITFLVKEWYAGFPLRGLLAGRGGALPVGEALRLLEQAAEAADHAARCRLGALDLALTEVHVAFPGLASSEDDLPARGLLPKRLADWPDWTLKTEALRINHDPLALDTWAGGATLVPTTGHDAPSAESGLENPHVRALANLIYELLGGAPRVHHFRSEPSPPRYGSLPVLNEEGNRLLRAALDGESAFAHGWELHEALVEAVGAEPSRGDPSLPAAPRPEVLPVVVPATFPPVGRRVVEEFPPEAASTVVSLPGGGESAAPFFHDGPMAEAHDPADPAATAGSSAWDRLSMAGPRRAHPGRWVAGGIGLAAVFLLGFVGVMAWLWQQMPAHAAVSAPVKKRVAAAPPPLASHPPFATPLAVRPPVGTPPSVPASPETLPTPTLAVETTPAPTATPIRERSPMVRLDSVPPGAQIRLGSEVLGTTPCRVRLPRGDHQLSARYQDWPETRQTIHLDGTETRVAVEIRLMRPDLVPGATERAAATPDNRLRKIFTPAAHRAPYAESFTPPPPARSEPEVRPAQRVLTPFQVDQPPEAAPPAQAAPTGNRQPFTVEGDKDDDR